MIEASTGYVSGHNGVSVASVAADVRAELPWLKLVVSFREPISQVGGGVWGGDVIGVQ